MKELNCNSRKYFTANETKLKKKKKRNESREK